MKNLLLISALLWSAFLSAQAAGKTPISCNKKVTQPRAECHPSIQRYSVRSVPVVDEKRKEITYYSRVVYYMNDGSINVCRFYSRQGAGDFMEALDHNPECIRYSIDHRQ